LKGKRKKGQLSAEGRTAHKERGAKLNQHAPQKGEVVLRKKWENLKMVAKWKKKKGKRGGRLFGEGKGSPAQKRKPPQKISKNPRLRARAGNRGGNPVNTGRGEKKNQGRGGGVCRGGGRQKALHGQGGGGEGENFWQRMSVINLNAPGIRLQKKKSDGKKDQRGG